jgi:hypothetical protein
MKKIILFLSLFVIAMFIVGCGPDDKTIVKDKIVNPDNPDESLDFTIVCEDVDGGFNLEESGKVSLVAEGIGSMGFSDSCQDGQVVEMYCGGYIKQGESLKIDGETFTLKKTSISGQSKIVEYKFGNVESEVDLGISPPILEYNEEKYFFKPIFVGDKNSFNLFLVGKIVDCGENMICGKDSSNQDGACVKVNSEISGPAFELSAVGKDSYDLKWHDGENNLVTMPLAVSVGAFKILLGNNHDYTNLLLFETEEIKKNDFFVLNANKASYLLKYEGTLNFDVATKSGKLKFMNLGSNEEILTSIDSDANGLISTLVINDNTFNIKSSEGLSNKDFGINVDLNGDGDFVSLDPVIYDFSGARVLLAINDDKGFQINLMGKKVYHIPIKGFAGDNTIKATLNKPSSCELKSECDLGTNNCDQSVSYCTYSANEELKWIADPSKPEEFLFTYSK